MKTKILKCFVLLVLSVVAIVVIVFFEIKNLPVGSSLGGLVAGITLAPLWASIVDFTDNTNWKASQRKLQRGKIIDKNTEVRISFAYLFRIKVNGKYFLVKNERGTGKYQPVGGVYKVHSEEANYLRQNFFAEDDNKIPVDESSKGDYRLRFKNRYLRKFVRRFDETLDREMITNLNREFKEEIFNTRILAQETFRTLTYTYCGRHMTDFRYGEHFQCYELLLADVVQVELTEEQEEQFITLMGETSDKYIFASDEEIKSLGVKAGSNELAEKIGDHTKKILMENANSLIRPRKEMYQHRKYTCSF